MSRSEGGKGMYWHDVATQGSNTFTFEHNHDDLITVTATDLRDPGLVPAAHGCELLILVTAWTLEHAVQPACVGGLNMVNGVSVQ